MLLSGLIYAPSLTEKMASSVTIITVKCQLSTLHHKPRSSIAQIELASNENQIVIELSNESLSSNSSQLTTHLTPHT